MSQSSSAADLHALAEEYWDGTMARHPTRATIFGDHRFDDLIEDLTPSGLEDEQSFAEAIAERARAIDVNELDDRDRVTRALLIDQCETTVESIASDEIQLRCAGFDSWPTTLLRAAAQISAPDQASAEALLVRLGRLPEFLDASADQWRAGVERGWVPALASVTRTEAMVEAYLGGPLDADPFVGLTLPAGWTGEERWRVEARELVEERVRPAYRRVADALRDLVAVGHDDDHPGLCHLPGGDELYASMVRRATTTDLSPQEIHDYGMSVLTDELPAMWAEIGSRAVGVADRDELFAHLASDPSMKYSSAEEILGDASAAVERALAAAPDWFERLPDAPVVVEAVPEHLAPGMPPAYYFPPTPDGSRPGTYFANTHAPTRRNRFESETICFHEAVPGHHLERALAVELTGVPTFQRRSMYMAYTEGWGLYAELLADEMSLYSSDVTRLGMLSADAWRSVRLVVDTGMHALGWTRAEALDFMVTHTPLNRDEAAVEIDRYIGIPAQAVSYKVGQRELRRLREHAEQRLGADFDVRRFHTVVLEHGGMPLGLLADVVDAWAEQQDS